jgi:CubicO group peptidase (beta-lactamase class C family)
MKLVLAALLSLATFSAQAHAAAANLNGLEQRVDAFVEKHRPHPQTGITVGVVENGKLVFSKSYGLRDREKNLPVTPSTLFALGSCTKSFVALGAAMLHDSGKLSLDQPVRGLLPEFALADLRVGQEATFTDLLSHRVGLPRHDLLWYLSPFDSRELYQRLPYLSLNRKPGKGFREGHQYNNLMYMVLGQALEQASGESWQELTRLRIFQPLGMSRANFAVEESQREDDFAQPYSGASLLPFKALPQVAPAGAINASLEDTVRWLAFLQAGGVTEEGERLVSEASFARLLKPESEAAFPEVGVDFKYGLGFFLNEVAGRRVVWHAGNIDGFSAHVSWMPEEKLGLVVLTNESAGNAFQLPWKLVRDGSEQKLLPYVLYEHMLAANERGLGLVEDNSLVSRLESVSPVPAVPGPAATWNGLTEALSQAAGEAPAATESVYEDLGYGLIYLRRFDGRLALDYYGTLLPLEPTLFPDLFHTPALDRPGKRWEIRLEKAGDEVVSVSVPFEAEVDPIVFAKRP